MNQYFSLFVTLSIIYLISQPDLVLTSSGGGYGGGGNSASKLNLGKILNCLSINIILTDLKYLFKFLKVSGFHR